MDADLIGYLLRALDSEAAKSVERRLETSPDMRRRLVVLRRALEPLEEDRDNPPAPPNLVIQTLKRVAEERCRQPALAIPITGSSRPGMRLRWRRVDVAIAAGIAFMAVLLVPPMLVKMQYRYYVMACADKLRHVSGALTRYETDHGTLPAPERHGPLATAGVYATMLFENGYLSDPGLVLCPASNANLSARIPTRTELFQSDQPNWQDVVGSCYGFHLGYVDERTEQFHPVSRKDLGGEVPIMADRPMRFGEPGFELNANSPNHSGLGQNVLYLAGHVRFLRQRVIGEDDIFLNRDLRIAAGLGPRDVVLAPSDASPFPESEDE